MAPRTQHEKFGRYRLHEHVGRGGMADVYRATIDGVQGSGQASSAAFFALKIMHEHLLSDPNIVEMFRVEEFLGRILDHPNMIRIHESGRVKGRPFIAMEYIRGTDVAQLIAALKRRRLRVPCDLAIYVTLLVLNFLMYLHDAKSPGGKSMDIVHRDISTSNIHITFAGDVKIGDLGVARVNLLESDADERVLKGKISYLPPEVLTGQETVSQSDDLWALSVCLYEMLTAEPLYPDTADDKLVETVVNRSIPPVRKVCADVDATLSRMLERALHPNPKKRPQTAAAYYEQLVRYIRTQNFLSEKETLARFVLAWTGDLARMVLAHEHSERG